MGRYTLSRKADDDLSNIWVQRIINGGTIENANALIEGFYATFERLGDFPDMGTRRDYLPPDALAFPHKKRHMIFYEKIVEGVEIVQVLPADMDFWAYFAEE